MNASHSVFARTRVSILPSLLDSPLSPPRRSRTVRTGIFFAFQPPDLAGSEIFT